MSKEMFTHCILPYCFVLTGMGGVVAPEFTEVEKEREKKKLKVFYFLFDFN